MDTRISLALVTAHFTLFMVPFKQVQQKQAVS